MKYGLNAAARTHVGRVRSNNEDNFYLQGEIREDVNRQEAEARGDFSPARFLAAVADGMGGEDRGELASLLAVQALKPCAWDQIPEVSAAAMDRANVAICREMEQAGGGRMGSTLTALYIDGERAVCCNIGDSPCYLLREGTLLPLSADHNKAARLIRLGVLTPEQAARHPSRHELTQHLGIFPEEMIIEPALSQAVTLQEGDRFLLCSDGLTDMVIQAEIAALLSSGDAPEEQAEALVQAALEAGGRDNVTVVVVRVEAESRPFWRRMFEGKPRRGQRDAV